MIAYQNWPRFYKQCFDVSILKIIMYSSNVVSSRLINLLYQKKKRVPTQSVILKGFRLLNMAATLPVRLWLADELVAIKIWLLLKNQQQQIIKSQTMVIIVINCKSFPTIYHHGHMRSRNELAYRLQRKQNQSWTNHLWVMNTVRYLKAERKNKNRINKIINKVL